VNHRVIHRILAIAGLLLPAIAVVAAWPSTATAQYFTINDFHSDIVINADGSMVVKETIALTFDRPRHGIFREIPFRYQSAAGDDQETPIDILSVTKPSGQKWNYSVSKKGNVINVRIGDADRYVKGRQTYVISYRVQNMIMYFDDHDELYWNVTGNYWKAPIERASATVTLATNETSSKLPTACYTGEYGSNQSQCDIETGENNATFRTTARLGVGEGLTIAFGFDKGLVAKPSGWQKFWWAVNLRENWVFFIPVIALVYMFVLWYRRGRDPKVREAVVVQYEPPEANGKPLTPAEVGTLVDEKLDPRDITSSIVGLGVKGYLQIREEESEGALKIFSKTDYRLKRLKQPDGELSPFERQLMNDIFVDGTDERLVSEMKNEFYKNLSSLKDTLYTGLVAKKFFPARPDKVTQRYVGAGFVIIMLSFLFMFAVGPSFKSVFSGAVAGVIVILFGGIMPVKTRAGALAVSNIRGFQEFMARADKDRLERMGKDIFYKYLPYAIALDVVDHWSRAFEGLYKEPPSWYVPVGGYYAFSPVAFSRNMTAVTSTLGSAMFSAPRGSGLGGGGGGGGFSGGGGGGGGGGSW